MPLVQKFTCNEIASQFFITNALFPPQLTANSCFWAFQTVSLPHELRCKMGRSGAVNAHVRAKKSRRNFSQRTHPIHPTRSQTHVLGRFGPFRYCTNFDAIRAEMVRFMHKFVQRSRVGIFTTNAPDPPHWIPKTCFEAFRTVSLLHEL